MKILGVVVKKNTVTILTDTGIYFFFFFEEKEAILKAIRKYHKNILIIE